jgi:hypothetical protein
MLRVRAADTAHFEKSARPHTQSSWRLSDPIFAPDLSSLMINQRLVRTDLKASEPRSLLV